MSTLELTAYGGWKNVSVTKFPTFVTVAGQRSYPACYYHIKPEKYKWMDGSKIKIFVTRTQDVTMKIYGGSSRTNASWTVVDFNRSVSAG